MRLRLATIEDLPRLVTIFKMYHEETPHTDVLGDPDERIVANYIATIISEAGFILVGIDPYSEEIVGAYAVELYRLLMYKPLLARDLFIYVHPAHRNGIWMGRAQKKIHAEARSRGAKILYIHPVEGTSEENSRRTTLAEKYGCSVIGSVMTKVL